MRRQRQDCQNFPGFMNQEFSALNRRRFFRTSAPVAAAPTLQKWFIHE
jgi:hypothetical protein